MTIARFSQDASLTDEIADIIRERILNGRYSIGEKIIEAPLANELSVSRTPIRQAFKKLESEGLVENIPNRGSFAKGFTKRDIQDIYEVRKVLEALAIEWAAERISEEDILKLEEIVELMEFYTIKKNFEKIMEVNKTFHEIIYKATESRFMAQILKSYQDYVEQARRTTVFEEEYLIGILNEHKGILNAVKKRDTKESTKLINQHLENSKKRTEAKWKRWS